MPVRKGYAHWQGSSDDGRGEFEADGLGGACPVSSRLRDEVEGSSPDQLLVASHASCFSMALAAGLGRAGVDSSGSTPPRRCISSTAGTGSASRSLRLRARLPCPA